LKKHLVPVDTVKKGDGSDSRIESVTNLKLLLPKGYSS